MCPCSLQDPPVSEDAAALLASNALVSELHSKVVPVIMEDAVFWSRYFYK